MFSSLPLTYTSGSNVPYSLSYRRFIAWRNSFSGSVFSTSAGVSQARRACRIPYLIFSKCGGVVRVGIDHDLDPALTRHAQMNVI